jgi:hypothetical protein
MKTAKAQNWAVEPQEKKGGLQYMYVLSCRRIQAYSVSSYQHNILKPDCWDTFRPRGYII